MNFNSEHRNISADIISQFTHSSYKLPSQMNELNGVANTGRDFINSLRNGKNTRITGEVSTTPKSSLKNNSIKKIPTGEKNYTGR